MAVSAKLMSKFAALNRQWWRLHMTQQFLSGTKNFKQSTKWNVVCERMSRNIYYLFFHYLIWFSNEGITYQKYICKSCVFIYSFNRSGWTILYMLCWRYCCMLWSVTKTRNETENRMKRKSKRTVIRKTKLLCLVDTTAYKEYDS